MQTIITSKRYLTWNMNKLLQCCIRRPVTKHPKVCILRGEGPCQVQYTSLIAELHSSTKAHSDAVRIPDFADTKSVYKSKSFGELFRSYTVFTLCSFEFLVNNQIKILQWSRKLLGRRLYCKLMELTIAGQFLAGEGEREVLQVARKNAAAGLFTMLAYTASESHGTAKGTENTSHTKSIYEINEDAVLHCIAMASKSKEFSQLTPQLATKATFFASADVLFSLNEIMEDQERTIRTIFYNADDATKSKFNDFLTKVLDESKTVHSGSSMPTLDRGNITSLSSLVTNLPFNLALNQLAAELVSFLKNRDVQPIKKLSEDERLSIITLWETMDKLGKNCHEEEVSLLVDAEQSYLQVAIECLTFDLMRKYNKDRPTIHNTYQCYRTRTHDIVVRDLELAQGEGFCIGFKVVRGAYLDEERRRAKTLNYEDPINPTYDATTDMYESVASHLLETIKTTDEPKRLHATFATHNQDTVKFVLQKMAEVDVPMENNNVAFAQLVGMRDHISFGLANMRYPVGKLLHYACTEDGMAWMSRRISENRSGMPSSDLERALLIKEVKRRLTRS